MEATIEVLREKLNEAMNQKAKYAALERPEYYEEVAMDRLTKEIDCYMHAISIIKAYRNFLRPEAKLKKVAQ